MIPRLDRPFRAAVAAFRSRLPEGSERVLFDLLCAAGQLCYSLPHDDIRLGLVSGARDPRRRLLRDFGHAWRAQVASASAAARAADRLTRRLVGELAAHGSGRARPLRVLLAYAPGSLAPDGKVPRRGLLGAAWKSVLRTFEKIFPAAVRTLPRLACVDGERLAALEAESRAGRRRGRRASGRRAGLSGRLLAVDPDLMRLAGRALGRPVRPGYQARYLYYTRAGDHFWPHPDDPAYDAQLLLCVDRVAPRAGRASAFLAYRSNGAVARFWTSPGSAVLVSPGRVHGREPVGRGESLVLLSIGLKFRSRRARAASRRKPE